MVSKGISEWLQQKAGKQHGGTLLRRSFWLNHVLISHNFLLPCPQWACVPEQHYFVKTLSFECHFLKLLIPKLHPVYPYARKFISYLMRVLHISLLVLSGQTLLAWNIAWHRPQVWLFMAISDTIWLICSTIPTTYWCKVKPKHVK